MPSDSVLTPRRRDVLLGLLALSLLSMPIVVGSLGLDEMVHTYERAEVSTDQGNVWLDGHSNIRTDAISDEIACSDGTAPYADNIRMCAFERYLAESDEDDRFDAGFKTGNPDWMSPAWGTPAYQYVWVNGTIYETTFAFGDEDDGGYHPVYLELEETDPEAALEDVSLDLEADRDEIPSAVVEAIEDGETQTHGEVDVPETTIRTDDGTYYRVGGTAQMRPSNFREIVTWLGRYAAPLAGLLLAGLLSRQIDVTYVGD
ncbi:hypothetical protein [Natronolimnohabitans innermongolicus]|nr:hypothetical protein [Natronolimnohabitans innermongolicus]